MSDRGLRRADWRFLLPAHPNGCFDQLVLLGGDKPLAEMLVNAGIAHRVSMTMTLPGTADAVVLLRSGKVSLSDAARLLQDGGVLYAEVDRRLRGRCWLSPRAAERQLREAGLSPTGAYLVLPSFDAGRRYIPIDHSGLLDWYFETLHSPRTPLALVASGALRLLAGSKHRRLGAMIPWYGITAIRGSSAGQPPSVLGHPGLPDILRPAGVRVLMLTSGQDDGSRVVILPFVENGKQPKAAVKVSRAPAFNGNTEREQATLAHIRYRLDQELRCSIPEPLGLVHQTGLAVAVETCAPGSLLTVTTGHAGRSFSAAVQDLRHTLTWLGEFQRQTRSGSNQWTSQDAAHLEAQLEQYARSLLLTEKVQELLRLTSAHSRALVGNTLPKVCLHNDLGPWNVYRKGDRITVIDWESGADGEAHRTGPALCDLIYFVTHWTLRARGLWSETTAGRGFRQLFIDPEQGGRASAAAHTAMGEFLSRSGINPGFVPPLLVYTWVERTLDQFTRAEASGADVMPATVSQYAEFIKAMGEAGERLFNYPLG